MRVVKQITFNSVDHADILAWLDRQDNESAAVRDAIREKMGIGLGDIYRKLSSFEIDLYKELQALKRNGVSTNDQAPAPLPVDEPTEAAMALDELLGG